MINLIKIKPRNRLNLEDIINKKEGHYEKLENFSIYRFNGVGC